MEDDLHFIDNGRRPQIICNWKTTSILLSMEDDLNFLVNGRQAPFLVTGGNLNFIVNGRRPQFCFLKGRQSQIIFKWKTTSNYLEIEDALFL